jgi:uracil-DNA glycosylase family 4
MTGEIVKFENLPPDAWDHQAMEDMVSYRGTGLVDQPPIAAVQGNPAQQFVPPSWEAVLASGATGKAGPMAPVWDRWRNCNLCRLCSNRSQVVLGSGNPVDPKYILIGEGPGANEDQEGTPFVGRTGQVLTQALNEVGIDRVKDCYLMNAVSCWPPGNRNPEREEIHACNPRLWEQLRVFLAAGSVKVIVLVGKPAYASVMRHMDLENPSFNVDDIRIGRMLGWGDDRLFHGNPKVYTVYHPSFIARKGPQSLETTAWMQDWEAIRYYVEDGILLKPRNDAR